MWGEVDYTRHPGVCQRAPGNGNGGGVGLGVFPSGVADYASGGNQSRILSLIARAWFGLEISNLLRCR